MTRAWLSVALLAAGALIAIAINGALSPRAGVVYLGTAPFRVTLAPEGSFPGRQGPGQPATPGQPGARPGQGIRPIASTAPSRSQEAQVRARLLRPVGLERGGAAAFVAPILTLLLVLILSIAGAALAPDRFARIRAATTLSRSAPVIHLFAGLATLVLLSITGLLLGVVVIGLTLQLLLILVTALAIAGGLTVATLTIGGWVRDVARWERPLGLLEIVCGALVLFIVGMIPILGWIVVGGAALTGIGALIVTRFGSPSGWSMGPLDRAPDA